METNNDKAFRAMPTARALRSDSSPETGSGVSTAIAIAPAHDTTFPELDYDNAEWSEDEREFDYAVCRTCGQRITDVEHMDNDGQCRGCSAELDEEFGEEEDDNAALLGYVCMSCGHCQGHPGLNQCDKCCGPLQEWYA